MPLATKRTFQPANPERTCPECGEAFTATHGRQTFCTTEHKQRFENVMAARGKVMAPFVSVWRTGKRGRSDQSAYALAQLARMADRWKEEDTKAGRRPDLIVQLRADSGWMAGDDQFTPHAA